MSAFNGVPYLTHKMTPAELAQLAKDVEEVRVKWKQGKSPK